MAALSLLALPAAAQDLTLSLGEGGGLTERTIQLLVLVTLLSLVPGLAVTITCFPFIVTVLSILRQAIGLQQAPPNMLIVSLALFLTWFVMEPVLTEAWARGAEPLIAGEADIRAAANAAIVPFRAFMELRVSPETLERLAALRPVPAGAETPLSVLVPSFLLSEIERAFQIGFLIFLPFLIIDLVIASVLMSMGMMMLPPVVISLPFKLIFFVLVDGWNLVAGSLVKSFGGG